MERKWILVVDDEKDIVEYVVSLIENHSDNYRIIVAHNGMEALQKTKMQKFHCIITDIRMPKVDGVRFIKSVRKYEINSSTPIIVLTGNPETEEIVDFKHVWLLEKPFDSKQLLSLIDKQISLGPINKRLPVEIINSFLESFKGTLNKVGLSAVISPPKTVLKSDTFKGNLFIFFQIKKGLNLFSFVMSIDSNNLKEKLFKKLLLDALKATFVDSEKVFVSNLISFNRSLVTSESLMGYKGITFEINNKELGVFNFTSIVGQEFVIRYIAQEKAA